MKAEYLEECKTVGCDNNYVGYTNRSITELFIYQAATKQIKPSSKVHDT